VDLPKLSVEMKYAEAIALAMKKEQEAMEMYDNFARASKDRDQQNIFLELAKMEKSHKTRLEELYNSVAFAEVW
jgi:rubrerythrin